MATLWIEEYAKIEVDDVTGAQIMAPCGAPTNQQKTITTPSAQSSAFQNTTQYVRLHADAACYIKFGTNPTAAADTTSEHLMANTYVDRAVSLGASWKVAVIQV